MATVRIQCQDCATAMETDGGNDDGVETMWCPKCHPGFCPRCEREDSALASPVSGQGHDDGKNTSYSTVTCVKLESGTVVGILVETGLPEEETANPCHGDEPGPFCRKCGARLEEEGE